MNATMQIWRRFVGALALVVTVSLMAITAVPGNAAAQATAFSASLSGAAEVPPVESDAGGSFSASVADGTLTYTLTSDAMAITQAHIHIGAADANGGVVAFLFGFEDGGVNGVDVSGSIGSDDVIGDIAGDFDALVAELSAGNAYVNVHTVAHPPGEVRGQIAATINPLAVYGSQLALYNAGEFEAGLALFAPDAVGAGLQVCGPAPTCDPRPAIQNAIAGGAWEGATFVIVDGSTTIEGNRLTAKVQNFFPALLGPIGYERTQIDVTVEVNDAGLISLWRVTPDMSDSETVAVLGAFAAMAAQAQATGIVNALAEAMNSGDIDAAVSLFADDGVIDLPNVTFAGSAEIRADLQGQIDNELNFTNVSIEVSGNTVSVVQEVRRPAITAAGLDRIIRLVTIELLDEKIVLMTAMPDTSDDETLTFQQAQMGGGDGGGGGGGGGGGAAAMPDALPNTGSGGLADSSRDGVWFTLSLVGAATVLALLAGGGAWVAMRRRYE